MQQPFTNSEAVRRCLTIPDAPRSSQLRFQPRPPYAAGPAKPLARPSSAPTYRHLAVESRPAWHGPSYQNPRQYGRMYEPPPRNHRVLDSNLRTPYASRKMEAFVNSTLGYPRVENGKSIPIPSYDPLLDPHLVEYFERRFGTMQMEELKRQRLLRRYARPQSAGSLVGRRSSKSSRLGRTKASGDVLYKVAVTTGTLKNSGTDAKVFIKVKGLKGKIPKTRLTKKAGSVKSNKGVSFRFAKGSTHVFKVHGPNIGDVQSLSVETSATKKEEAWFLQEIEIVNTKTKKSWLFKCNQWFSLYHGDGQVSRELFPAAAAKTEYEIVTVTGDVLNGGTNANVFLTLFGKTGNTRKIHLKNNNKTMFNRGSTDVFKVRANCVGPMKKVRIEHDNQGVGAGWYLERVVVSDLHNHQWKYFFPCGQWLAKDEGDGAICRDLIGSRDPLASRKASKYKVTVFTGDKRGAGTDANVYITMFGEFGDSGEKKLTKKLRNNFERGQKDEFLLECPKLGRLERVRIGHDNTGFGPGWYLDKVRFSLTKRTRKSGGLTEEGRGSPGHHHNLSAYDNPAFAADQVAIDAEEGRGNYSPKKNQSPGKKQSPTKDANKKTWASLPVRDFPDGLHRQGSCGSLDNNYLSSGPETESVWLQSQDIIGLGFNISGNMRDGIYVSQVHNRGPAIESGKIKVGDRIVSVTIAYDNIVYEDALTILSYASPYPVKVTLQKERTISPENRSSSTEQLNHPLYRSQSLDTLPRLSKEPPFKPKRTLSEMKSETRRDSPGKSKKASDRKTKALSQTYPDPAKFDVTDNVTVHASEMLAQAVVETKGANNHQPQDVIMAEISQHVQSAPPGTAEASVEDETAASGRKKSKFDTEAAREFASLMDQVLDDKRSDLEEDVTAQKVTGVSMSPKTPPAKPERKKKPSSSSLSSFDLPDAVLNGVEETISAATASTAQALPKAFEPTGPEVEEEEIQPSSVKREVVIGNDSIEFSPIEPEKRAERRPPSPDTLAGFVMADYTPPQQPQWEEVQEELIEASVAARDAQAAPLPSAAKEAGEAKEKKEKKKEKKEQKPALDDETLERLIAMNAFPPGTQGWAGIQRGGKQGGIHDEFLPAEVREALNGEHSQRTVHARSDSSSSSEASSRGRGRAPRGGVAFEVRDDVMTGKPVAVEIRSRDSSASTSRSTSRDRMVRASSLRDEHVQHHENKENREEGLDWSGKRLVRAGSFSEIHQVDSVSDWTDKNVLNDDDDNSTTSGKRSTTDPNVESDSEVEPQRAPPGRDIFRARENLANMSDLSNSISSSRSSSPAVTNGPDVTSSSGLPSLKSNSGGIDLTPTSDSNANSKTINFTLHANADGDADC